MKSKFLLTLTLAFGLAANALAADQPDPNSTLTKMVGQVSVNAGDGFQPAAVDMRLKPGDRVMVQDKSGATIVFDDKCRLDIEASKLVVVPDRSACAGAIVKSDGLTLASGPGTWSPYLGLVVLGVLLTEDGNDTASP